MGKEDKAVNGKAESLEKTLFKAADKMRKNIDAAEYKHIALGLIFLKYISDSFESLHNKLIEGKGDYKDADPEDADEYRVKNIFFVPSKTQWLSLSNDLTENIIYCIICTVFLIFKRKKKNGFAGDTINCCRSQIRQFKYSLLW